MHTCKGWIWKGKFSTLLKSSVCYSMAITSVFIGDTLYTREANKCPHTESWQLHSKAAVDMRYCFFFNSFIIPSTKEKVISAMSLLVLCDKRFVSLNNASFSLFTAMMTYDKISSGRIGYENEQRTQQSNRRRLDRRVRPNKETRVSWHWWGYKIIDENTTFE